jgi:hypothetical protein
LKFYLKKHQRIKKNTPFVHLRGYEEIDNNRLY